MVAGPIETQGPFFAQGQSEAEEEWRWIAAVEARHSANRRRCFIVAEVCLLRVDLLGDGRTCRRHHEASCWCVRRRRGGNMIWRGHPRFTCTLRYKRPLSK
jgi:hypothetical protein